MCMNVIVSVSVCVCQRVVASSVCVCVSIFKASTHITIRGLEIEALPFYEIINLLPPSILITVSDCHGHALRTG